MRRTFFAVLALVPIVACSPVATEVQATCVAVLVFNGGLFGPDDSDAQITGSPGAVVGEVARNIGCNDTPEPGATEEPRISNGDSNFLPVGTEIHAVVGDPVSERLAVRPDTVWVFLRSR